MNIISKSTYVIHYSNLFPRLSCILKDCSATAQIPVIINEAIAQLYQRQFNDETANEGLHTWLEMHRQVNAILPILIQNLTGNQLAKSANHVLMHQMLSAAREAYSPSTREHTFQHIVALEMIADRQDAVWSLVIEDDAVLLNREALVTLGRVLSLLPASQPCFVDVGHGWNEYSDLPMANYTSDLKLVPVDSGRTRCSYAYMVNAQCAREIVRLSTSSPKDIILPSDWHLAHALRHLQISTYWSNLPAFRQGSLSIYGSNASHRLMAK
jgi:hypothetical protein